MGKVEYEGLHLICFGCGQFGHRKDACSLNIPNATAAATNVDSNVSRQGPTHEEGSSDAGFGPWMIVQRKGHRPVKDTPGKEKVKADGEGSESWTRFDDVSGAGRDSRNRYNPLNVVPLDSGDKAKEPLSTVGNVKSAARWEWVPKKQGGIKIVSKSALKKGQKDKKKVGEAGSSKPINVDPKRLENLVGELSSIILPKEGFSAGLGAASPNF
ncbi:Zinc knuckle CX2CX4HX4C [Corchorus capsularis]|uniref:Zinc knuckle CX2CX4HX4C n=1 Tax=Corchorus capsularis TaxID=210143 RepID=A0A1R3I5J6_COCAP|nr:Zinc knuckle CX2CX4HX4C [Corchorus capsularis]